MLGIALVAFSLRLWAALRFSYWGDEGFSCIAITDFGEALHYLSYTLINRAVYEVFGMNYFVLRLVSVAYGTAAVVVFFFFLDLIAGRRAALAGSVMLSLSPLAIQVSSEIRNYSFFLLNILVCATLLELYIRQQKRKWLFVYLLHLPVLLTSHMLAVLLPLAQVVVRLCAKDRRLFGWAAAASLIGLLALIAFREPLLRFVWPIIGGHEQNFVPGSGSRAISLMSGVKAAQALFAFFFGFGVPVGWYAGAASLVVMVVVLRQAKLLASRGDLLVWTFLPLAVVFLVVDALVPGFFPSAQAKYALVALPPFFAILAITSTAGVRALPAMAIVALLAVNTALMFAGRYSLYPGYITDYASGYRKFAGIDAFVANGPSRFPLQAEAWKQRRNISIAAPHSVSRLPQDLIAVTGGWKAKDTFADNEMLDVLHRMGYRVIDAHSSWNMFFFRMSRNASPAVYFQPRVGGTRYRYLRFPIQIGSDSCLFYAELERPLRVTLPLSRKATVYYLLTARPQRSTGGMSVIAGPDREPLDIGVLRDWRESAGSVHSFHKPFDSIGASRYPGAYSSFDAHIHSIELSAAHPFTELTITGGPGYDIAILGVRPGRKGGEPDP